MIGGVLHVCEEWKFMCESKVWRGTSSYLINSTQRVTDMQNFFSCFGHFLVDLGALVHRKKFQSFRPSIFGVTSS